MADNDDPARPQSRSETPRTRPTVATLNEEVQRLMARIQELEEVAQPLTPSGQSYKEPKIGEPPTYNGKAAEFHPFLQQCKLYIRMKPITFAHDDARVAYFLSRLRGMPAEWGQALLEADSPLLTNYDAFLEQFTSLYENKARRRQLEERLESMEQTGSAHAFAAEFTSLCEILDVKEGTRKILFLPKLKLGVRKALALVQLPPTFKELVDLAVRTDDINFIAAKAEKAEQKAQSKHSAQQHLSASASQSKTPAPSQNSSSHPRFNSQSSNRAPSNNRSHPYSNASHSQSAPHPDVSVPRPHLTPEEKERRIREGLCTYCGEPGHSPDTCGKLQFAQQRGLNRSEPNKSTFCPFRSSTAHVISPISSTSIPAPTPQFTNPPPFHSGKQDPQFSRRQEF
jgi:Ty3 transposon capsid-like protein